MSYREETFARDPENSLSPRAAELIKNGGPYSEEEEAVLDSEVEAGRLSAVMKSFLSSTSYYGDQLLYPEEEFVM
jgi:hypothetical protein